MNDRLGLRSSVRWATAGPLVQQPAWWLSQIVVDSWVVGDIGFHGPPGDQAPARVEIGYCVVPSWRGRGVASRACALIVEQAWTLGAAVISEVVAIEGFVGWQAGAATALVYPIVRFAGVTVKVRSLTWLLS